MKDNKMAESRRLRDEMGIEGCFITIPKDEPMIHISPEGKITRLN